MVSSLIGRLEHAFPSGYKTPLGFENIFSKVFKFVNKPKKFELSIPGIENLYVVKLESRSDFNRELILLKDTSGDTAAIFICKDNKKPVKDEISEKTYGVENTAVIIKAVDNVDGSIYQADSLSYNLGLRMRNTNIDVRDDTPNSLNHNLSMMSAVVVSSTTNSTTLQKAIGGLFSKDGLFGDTIIIPNDVNSKSTQNLVESGASVLFAEEKLREFSGNFMMDFMKQNFKHIMKFIDNDLDLFLKILSLKIPIISQIYDGSWETNISKSRKKFVEQFIKHELNRINKK